MFFLFHVVKVPRDASLQTRPVGEDIGATSCDEKSIALVKLRYKNLLFIGMGNFNLTKLKLINPSCSNICS